MTSHNLKIDVTPFDDLLSGAKTCEVRNDDRGFAIDDIVHLTCSDGRTTDRTISHIQRGYGLPDGICVLSYTRATPSAVTLAGLVRYDKEFESMFEREDGKYVLHSQAAEIIRSMIPRVNNCGRYIAERNDGTLMYLNHGNTWQGCDNFISAKDKEIERLKNLIDGDDCPDPDKIDALFRRAEAAEAKLAQYEAQEPVGCATVYIYKGRRNLVLNELGNNTAGNLPIGEHKLYASPAPAADLKAENEDLKSQVNNLIDEINDLQETITSLENKYT